MLIIVRQKNLSFAFIFLSVDTLIEILKLLSDGVT